MAFLIWSLGLGGAEQVVIRLAAALDRTRFEPIVICLNEPGRFAPQVEREGIEVIALHKRGAIDVRMFRTLVALLRQRHIDVVHTHLWGANLWGRLAARFAGVPLVVSTEHNVDVWKRRHHFLLDRWLARLTDHLVAVSGQVHEFYRERGVGQGRWKVVYNGIDTSEAPRRERGPEFAALGIPDGSPVVALIGRLVPAKAPELFLRALELVARDIPQVRALLVGDGPSRAETEAEVRRLGLERHVIFAGLREDVPALLRGIDVLVFSSTREGLSIAMLEAMAAGVPVVATRVGGNPELIDSGESGFLVPSGDAQALASHVTSLLRDPALAASVRQAARTKVDTRFSLRAMVAAHEALYAGAPLAE